MVVLLGHQRSNFSSLGFLTWRPQLGLRASRSTLTLCMRHMHQCERCGHSRGGLASECWTTCSNHMLSSRNLELGLRNTGLNLSGTSDDVTSGAVGQYVREEAQSKPFTWSRNKVYREDREPVAPGRGWESTWFLPPATARHCPGIPGTPQVPHNQSPFLQKLVSKFLLWKSSLTTLLFLCVSS